MEDNEILNNNYFKVNRFLLKLTGLWPYQKSHVKLIIRTLYIFAIHSMMIPQVCTLFVQLDASTLDYKI